MEYLALMLKEAFNVEVDEFNYHDIVSCLRYAHETSTIFELRPYLIQYGFPSTYNPFEHMEDIRWGMMFGDHNRMVDEYVALFKNKYAISK